MRSYCSVECKLLFAGDDEMRDEILGLRKLGLSIGEIANHTGYSITQVCEVIRTQNDLDINNDK